jgi:hypothetical protein
MNRYSLLAVLGLIAAVAGAHAQAPISDEAKAMAEGTWEFSNADRDKRCMLTFRTDPAAAGMRLEFERLRGPLPVRQGDRRLVAGAERFPPPARRPGQVGARFQRG